MKKVLLPSLITVDGGVQLDLRHRATMTDIEDEPFPSFLSASSVNSSRASLGNVTLGFGLGLPVAASTVAKIRAGVDNRWDYTTLHCAA